MKLLTFIPAQFKSRQQAWDDDRSGLVPDLEESKADLDLRREAPPSRKSALVAGEVRGRGKVRRSSCQKLASASNGVKGKGERSKSWLHIMTWDDSCFHLFDFPTQKSGSRGSKNYFGTDWRSSFVTNPN